MDDRKGVLFVEVEAEDEFILLGPAPVSGVGRDFVGCIG